MKLKRLLAIMLCMLLLLPASSALSAKKSKKAEELPVAAPISPLYVEVDGIIKHVDTRQKSIEIMPDGGTQSIVLHMGNTPRVINNATRGTIALTKLKQGDRIRAFHSPAVTASNPPQTSGLAMIANIESGAQVGNYFEVKSVGRSGSTYTLLNHTEDIRLHVPSNITMRGFTKSAQTKISAMKPGACFLYWPSEIKEGAPSEISTGTILMFPYEYDGYLIVLQGHVNVNGYMLGNVAIVEETETFIPIMEAAERLGLLPKYTVSSKTMKLKYGSKILAEFTVGSETYVLGKQTATAPASKLIDGVMYVPLGALQSVRNLKTVTDQ